MPRPSFIDVHPHNGSSGFFCSNEEPALWRWLIQEEKFDYTGAIASSGDVLLSTLLPRSKRLFAVDHNYGSLAAAFTKAVLLDKLGARAFMATILERPEVELQKALTTEIKDELPEALRSKVLNVVGSTQELRRIWASTSLTDLEAARKRLEQLTLIHGDIMDLSRHGRMDCLYVSNAVDSSHNDRHDRIPRMDDAAALLHGGGKMLIARGTAATVIPETPTCRHIKRVAGTDQIGACRWVYDLYERKPVGEMVVRESITIGTTTIRAAGVANVK